MMAEREGRAKLKHKIVRFGGNGRGRRGLLPCFAKGFADRAGDYHEDNCGFNDEGKPLLRGKEGVGEGKPGIL